MQFRIHNQSLTDFFKSYHSDVLNRPEWERGDVTRIEARRFDDLARSVWKLEFRGYSSPYYLFEVLDEDRVREIGLANHGDFIEQ